MRILTSKLAPIFNDLNFARQIGHVWDISGDPVSPIKHLRLHYLENSSPAKSDADANEVYENVMDAARARGLLLTIARYTSSSKLFSKLSLGQV